MVVEDDYWKGRGDQPWASMRRRRMNREKLLVGSIVVFLRIGEDSVTEYSYEVELRGK